MVEHEPVEALRRLGGSDCPGHDVDVLLVEQGREPRALPGVPPGMVAVEEAADHQVGLACPAMVRTPVKGLQFIVVRHGAHVGRCVRPR